MLRTSAARRGYGPFLNDNISSSLFLKDPGEPETDIEYVLFVAAWLR
jgi:hypothetical protein